METKAMLRIRKFSWNKTHSVKMTDDRSNSLTGQKNPNPVNLKRSGSMNNIILGLRTEATGNHQQHQNGGESRRRRTQTFRLRAKKNSKTGLESNGTPNKKSDHGSSDSLPKDQTDSPSHWDCNNVTSPITRLSMFAPLVGIPTSEVSNPKDETDSTIHRDCNNVTSPITRLSMFAPPPCGYTNF